MDFDQFAGLRIDVVHVGDGPVNFIAFFQLMTDPACQAVLDRVSDVSFVELCLSHGDRHLRCAFFNAFVVKKISVTLAFFSSLWMYL